MAPVGDACSFDIWNIYCLLEHLFINQDSLWLYRMCVIGISNLLNTIINRLMLVPKCILTHWGRAMHICVNKLTIIASDNGLSPGRRQAIIWNNSGILSIGLVGTNFNEILIEILTFSFKKMHLKVSSAKWRPFCLGLNVLRTRSTVVDDLGHCVAMTSSNKILTVDDKSVIYSTAEEMSYMHHFSLAIVYTVQISVSQIYSTRKGLIL